LTLGSLVQTESHIGVVIESQSFGLAHVISGSVEQLEVLDILHNFIVLESFRLLVFFRESFFLLYRFDLELDIPG